MRFLRTISGAIATALVAIFVTACGAEASKDAKPDPKKQQAETEAIMVAFRKLASDYNEKPDPKLALVVIRNFHTIPHQAPQALAASDAFVAGLIATNPEFITHLAPIYDELTDETGLGLVRAIMMSGREDWADRLSQLRKMWPGRAKIIDGFVAKGPQPITSMDPLAHQGLLDMLWAYYGATASPKAVETIVSALAGVHEKQIASRLMIAYAAKYSIAAKASDSPKFAALCKPLLTGPHGSVLRDALLAAETNNFDRLKSEATAAIHAVAPPPPPREEKVLRKNQR